VRAANDASAVNPVPRQQGFWRRSQTSDAQK
jgi:hypothetical protein